MRNLHKPRFWFKKSPANSKRARLSTKSPLKKPVSLGASDTLKVLLTATEDGKAKRPHQAFLLLQDQDTGVDATLPFTVKDSGKAKVDIVSFVSNWHLHYG